MIKSFTGDEISSVSNILLRNKLYQGRFYPGLFRVFWQRPDLFFGSTDMVFVAYEKGWFRTFPVGVMTLHLDYEQLLTYIKNDGNVPDYTDCILGIFVKERYRNKGIASALISSLDQESIVGCDPVVLDLVKKNPKLKPFALF